MIQIIIPQNNNTNYKRYYYRVRKRVTTKKGFGVNPCKLTKHPIRVGGNPNIVMGRLWQSSATICIVRQAISIEIVKVGTIITMPEGFQTIH